jgi:ribonuclease HII
VVAAAVIFPPEVRVRGVRDSKTLSADERESLRARIERKALAIGVGTATPAEIDTLNILWASMRAMRRAVADLRVRPQYVLIDGNRCFPDSPWAHTTIVDGDALSHSISAASIIAKTTRDRLMHALHEQYPQYAWVTNVGYPTREHFEALRLHGPTSLHRRSFRLDRPLDAPLDLTSADWSIQG